MTGVELLALVTSDQGIRLAGLLAAAAFGGDRFARARAAARRLRALAVAELSADVFEAVERGHQEGKLDPAIKMLGGNVSMAKWSKAVELFAAGWKARTRTAPVGDDLARFRAYIERRALSTPADAGRDVTIK